VQWDDGYQEASMRTVNLVLVAGLMLAQSQVGSFQAYAQDRERRDLAGFDAIAVSSGIDLFVRQGPDHLVEVVSSGDDSDEILTEVNDGTLHIRLSRSAWSYRGGDERRSVHVTLPELASLTASGGADVSVEGSVTGDALRVGASGGSDVRIDVAVDTLDVQASGGADVTVSGSTGSARISTSGGSDVDGDDLSADEANLNSSGGSDISITVLNRLVAAASGGSDITYRGDPESVDVDTSGAADIQRR
jgi:hypothetical protein